MDGYNDDLVMSYAIALWVRDTALRLKSDRDSKQRMIMDSMINNNGRKSDDSGTGFSNGSENKNNPWSWDTGEQDKEDLTWLIK